MGNLDFATCFEVDDELIAEALAPAASLSDSSPRDKVFALLERMAEISLPRQGASRALVVLAHVSTCSWLDGVLNVQLSSAGEQTVFHLSVDDGLSLNRLHSPLVFHVPLLEFEQSVRRRAKEIEPLSAKKITSQSIELASSAEPTAAPEEAVQSSVFRPEQPPRSVVSGAGGVHRKPTVKIKAVKIPHEAYREDDPRSIPPGPDSETTQVYPADMQQLDTKPPLADLREPAVAGPAKIPNDLPVLEPLELDDEVTKPAISAKSTPVDDETIDIDEGWG